MVLHPFLGLYQEQAITPQMSIFWTKGEKNNKKYNSEINHPSKN